MGPSSAKRLAIFAIVAKREKALHFFQWVLVHSVSASSRIFLQRVTRCTSSCHSCQGFNVRKTSAFLRALILDSAMVGLVYHAHCKKARNARKAFVA